MSNLTAQILSRLLQCTNHVLSLIATNSLCCGQIGLGFESTDGFRRVRLLCSHPHQSTRVSDEISALVQLLRGGASDALCPPFQEGEDGMGPLLVARSAGRPPVYLRQHQATSTGTNSGERRVLSNFEPAPKEASIPKTVRAASLVRQLTRTSCTVISPCRFQSFKCTA